MAFQHHPKLRFRNFTGRSQLLVTGRSHGLAAAAPGHGQVALGAKKVAPGPGPPGPGPAPVRATFFVPSVFAMGQITRLGFLGILAKKLKN